MALMFNFYKGEVAQIDQWTILAPRTWARLIGSLSNDDGDVKRDGKKAIGLDWKLTTTLHVHHAFLYISLSSLYVIQSKTSQFTFYGGREHKI